MAKNCLVCGTQMSRSRQGYRCPKCGRAFRFTGPDEWVAYQPPRDRVAQTLAVMEACGVPALIKADGSQSRLTVKENGRIFGYCPKSLRHRKKAIS